MNITQFNYIEAGFWILCGASLLRAGFYLGIDHPLRKTARVAGTALGAFGVSDILEAQTGAWWRPPILLVFKFGCIAVLFVCWRRYSRVKRKTYPRSIDPK